VSGDPPEAAEPAQADSQADSQSEPQSQPAPALVPGALDRARQAARRRGTAPGRRIRRGQAEHRRGQLQEFSGPGPDDRDPQLLGSLVDGMVAEQGWTSEVRVGAIVGRWPELVGPEIADHCQPARYADGALTLVAESTAWAAQLRLLCPQLHRRLTAELGPGVVTSITVRGPTAPSWRTGRWRVTGRGPRDTYG
jgi:predicted nucleic acid-binding Zn ribbon protein